MDSRPLITRVVLENYKSIAFCDVKLGPLSILIGPNGAGKSNFLDALHLLSDAMNGPLDQTLYKRGDFASVLRRGAKHLGIRIEFSTAACAKGYYSVRLQQNQAADYTIEREQCRVHPPIFCYEARDGALVRSRPERPAPTVAPTQLYLPIMAAYPEFKPVFDFIASTYFYNFTPKEFRQPIPTNEAERALLPDGANLANVLHRIWKRDQPTLQRIIQYLQGVNPNLRSLEPVEARGYTNLEFLIGNATGSFSPGQVSEGTLRSLAVLVALSQKVRGLPVNLVALEEPESAIYPAAACVLFDAMREASASVQVIATTHSADLLDKKEIDTDAILAVEMYGGTTQIGHVNEIGRQALKERLYTAGELMRMNYLRPEPSKTPDDSEIESVLFGDLVPA
jgi:predicted ATPase